MTLEAVLERLLQNSATLSLDSASSLPFLASFLASSSFSSKASSGWKAYEGRRRGEATVLGAVEASLWLRDEAYEYPVEAESVEMRLRVAKGWEGGNASPAEVEASE